MMKKGAWSTAIAEHYRRLWGEFATCLPPGGPAHELPNDFVILCFPPTQARNMWTYATRGMAQPEDAFPLELHLVSPYQDGGLVELLYATVHYHCTGARLGLGHSINFGRPWLAGSACDRGLVSLPYLDGPKLEICHAQDRDVRCLWLIPITAAEAQLKQSLGLETLEQRFEQSGFNYLDPHRSSVA